jgi:hypothetical protein
MCERCGLRVCPWCYSHVHALHVELDKQKATKH